MAFRGFPFLDLKPTYEQTVRIQIARALDLQISSRARKPRWRFPLFSDDDVHLHRNGALPCRRTLFLSEISALFLADVLHFPARFSAVDAPASTRVEERLREDASARVRSIGGHRRDGILLQRENLEDERRAGFDVFPEHVGWDFARVRESFAT